MIRVSPALGKILGENIQSLGLVIINMVGPESNAVEDGNAGIPGGAGWK